VPPMGTRARGDDDGSMPRPGTQSDGGRLWLRYLGELSRIFVIGASVLATVAAILLLGLVFLRFLGIA
jgi:hypothetical protein